MWLGRIRCLRGCMRTTPTDRPQPSFCGAITMPSKASLLRTEVHWRIVASGTHEAICHSDWVPCNAVFSGHIPIAMLDWDGARLGSAAGRSGRQSALPFE